MAEASGRAAGPDRDRSGRRARRWRSGARAGVRRCAAGLLAAAAAAACGEPAGTSIIVGMRNDFGGFNPVTNSDLYTGEVINYALFTPLVQYEPDLTLRPYLAESWRFEGDTAIVFKLRGDVRWHDGRRVTAEDVEFTFDLAKDPATASLLGSAFLAEVESATVVDSLTVRFDFERPHAQAIEDFWWAPLPKHLLDGVPPAELRNAPFNREPVGSGPFRFVEWRAGERLVIEPNESFTPALGGPARATRVVFRIVPEASTLLTELVTGGVHVDIPVLPDQVETIEEDPEIRLFSYPGRTVYYIGWNNERPPFDDVRVRRAFALALDREAIIAGLLRGQAEAATSTIPPWHPLYPSEIEPLGPDISAADALLDEAGWVDDDSDGVREDLAGRPLRFTMLTSDDPLRRNVAELLQSQFRQIGAAVELRVLEFQTMLARHRNRDFDAVLTNWVLDNFQVAAAPYALFHSSQADVELSANRSGVRIPELDMVIEQGAVANDEATQRRLWREMTGILREQQPVTFLFWLNELAGARVEVVGVEMDPRGELLTLPFWALVGG